MTSSVTPLRQRMLDDMALRNMSPNTQKAYTRAIANFALYFRQSPDKLGLEEIRHYRLHLIERGLKASSMQPIVGALRFFYGVTMGRKDIAAEIPFARREDTLPAVLSPEEVVRLLEAVERIKMRVALTTIYAAGLRVSEVVTLTA